MTRTYLMYPIFVHGVASRSVRFRSTLTLSTFCYAVTLGGIVLYVTYGCADCLFDKRGGFGLFSWVKDRDLGFANGERRCTFRGSERRESSLLIVNSDFCFFTYMTSGRKESAKYIQKLLIVFFSDVTRKIEFC